MIYILIYFSNKNLPWISEKVEELKKRFKKVLKFKLREPYEIATGNAGILILSQSYI